MFWLAASPALGVQQEGTHGGVRSHGGGGHADVLGTDGVADVLTVQVDVLCAVQQADIQPDLRQQCGHGVGVVGIHARAHGVQPMERYIAPVST